MTTKYSLILLVEDDAICAALNTMLIDESVITDRLVTARNGRLALEYIDKHIELFRNPDKPVLILLDLMMPEMDGFEFLNAYNKLDIDKEKVSICILSSSSNPKDMERTSALGALCYFEKPLTSQNISELLHH